MSSRVFAVVVLFVGACAQSAEPTVRNVDVRGLQIGGKTTVAVDGADLGTAPKLLLPFPTAKVELKAGATAARAIFEVELPSDVTPGTYQFRIATDDGVSSPVVFGVDRMPQIPFTPEIKTPLPVALHGSVAGSGVLETRFTGKCGDEVMIEVESTRLGSKVRPVIHLLDESRKQLAWAWPQRSLAGDTRLRLKLPKDGSYFVQLHDGEYQSVAPPYFRLKIGTWHFAETAFPAAVARGKTTAVELIGNLPAAKVEVNPTAGQFVPSPWPAGANVSGPRISVQVSDLPEIVEQPSSGSAQEITQIPVAISGRLLLPNEKDSYALAVTAGAKLKFEVFAERIGSPIDPVLLVLNDKGATLVRGDDGPGTIDPVLEFTVPDKTTSITLTVSDLLGRGGESAVYRLVVTSATDSTTQRDFRLFTPNDRLRVTQNGATVVPITVQRKGYDGAIRLNAAGLPAGVTLASNEIPAGADGTLLEFKNAAPATAVGLFTLTGTSEDGQIIREVLFEQHPLGDLQPWLRGELAVSLAAEQKFQIEWRDLPTDASLPLAGKLNLPLKFTRPEGEATAIRLSLVTAQNVPKVNNTANPDPAQAIRAEKPVEIAPDKNDGEMDVLTPFSLSAPVYDVAVVAELLSKDKKTVLATATTPPRRLPTLIPLKIQLASTPWEAKLEKAGATVKLTGKVERLVDFKGAVTLAATGVPAGVRAASVVVKADAADFEFPIVFPANFAAGDVTEIKLNASGPPDPARANQLIRTKDIPLTIKLVADAK